MPYLIIGIGLLVGLIIGIVIAVIIHSIIFTSAAPKITNAFETSIDTQIDKRFDTFLANPLAFGSCVADNTEGVITEAFCLLIDAVFGSAACNAIQACQGLCP